MAVVRWIHTAMNWAMILLVAMMLPASCIVHCHLHPHGPTETHKIFVCHPMDALQHNSNGQALTHDVTLRAIHEVFLPFLVLVIILLGFMGVFQGQHIQFSWISPLRTPPPRLRTSRKLAFSQQAS